MARRRRPPNKAPRKTVKSKSALPIAYRYCRACRRYRTFINGRCSACS
jgi:hypothetical protein